MTTENTSPVVTANHALTVDFFHDFLAYLQWLKEKPIKLTATGNISLKDIEQLIPQLKTAQHTVEEFNKHGWRLHLEDYLKTLTQIKITAQVMHLTYKRKSALLLSKNGKGFLTNLHPLQQYDQMVLHYWYRVNWEYFTPSKTVNEISLSEALQKKQNYFWRLFLEKNTDWIDYPKFCQVTRDYFQLQTFFEHQYFDSEYELLSDIRHVLFRNNLMLFGCVEIEEGQGKYDWQKEIVRFRSTPLGLHIFHKSLHENYL